MHLGWRFRVDLEAMVTRHSEKRWLVPSLCSLLACILLSVRFSEAQTAPPVLDDAVVHLLQSGAASMHQGKTADAEGYFRQAVAAAPTLPDAYLGLGMAQLREGKTDEAESALAKALELNPNMRGAHMFLGIAQYQRNKLDAATAALQAEVTAQPENVEALTWLGIVELGAGRPEEATGPLDRAAVLSPKDPNVLDYRGRAHSLVAQESYRALTALDPDSWRVHRALGEIAAESKQWQNAVVEYQKAIEKQKENPDLYEVLGEAYQHLSRFDEATRAYEAELKLSPRNAIALFNLGRIQVLNGDPTRGVALLRQAVEAHVRSAPADYYLGLGLAQTGHPEEAATSLERCLEQQPTASVRERAYYQLVRVYQTLHRPDNARHAAEELKKLKAISGNTGAEADQSP
jgi:Flp pilus assembly protein TadD